MNTLAELKTHMEKYKDATIIIGEECLNKDTIIEKEIYEKFLNKKLLIRRAKEFWRHFKEQCRLINKTEKSDSQKAISDLVKSNLIKNVVDLNTDNNISFNNTIQLHGNMSSFECTKCDITYTSDYINYEDDREATCEICGKTLRPTMLLLNETYKDEDFKKVVEILNSTHTLITIGLNYSEEPIFNLLCDYCELKSLDQKEEKVLIGIYSKENHINEVDINKEIGFHDFLVVDDCNEAIKRLTEGLR